jgi:hypothetical protein
MEAAKVLYNLNVLKGLREQSGFKLAYNFDRQEFCDQGWFNGLRRTWDNRDKEGDEKQSVASNKHFITPIREIFAGARRDRVSRRVQAEALQGLQRLRTSYSGGSDREKLAGLDSLIVEVRSWILPNLADDLRAFLDRIFTDRNVMESLSAQRPAGGHGIEPDSPLDDRIYDLYCTVRRVLEGRLRAWADAPESKPKLWVDNFWRTVQTEVMTTIAAGRMVHPWVMGHDHWKLHEHASWRDHRFDYYFMWFRHPRDRETAFRVYLHPKVKRQPTAVFEVVNFLLQEKRARRLSFFKVTGPKHIRKRNDRIVVYCESGGQAVELAATLRNSAAVAGRFGRQLPPLTAALFPRDPEGYGGIAIGEEPMTDRDLAGRGRLSFGSSRAKAIANAIAEYRRHTGRFGPDRDFFNCLVAEEFFRLNLDPTVPFRNLEEPAAAG